MKLLDLISISGLVIVRMKLFLSFVVVTKCEFSLERAKQNDSEVALPTRRHR